jgi:enoyl-CoA hydratase/carnithine racemase
MAVSPIGLANRVVSPEALDAEVATLTTLIASKSPAALASGKQVFTASCREGEGLRTGVMLTAKGL